MSRKQGQHSGQETRYGVNSCAGKRSFAVSDGVGNARKWQPTGDVPVLRADDLEPLRRPATAPRGARNGMPEPVRYVWRRKERARAAAVARRIAVLRSRFTVPEEEDDVS